MSLWKNGDNDDFVSAVLAKHVVIMGKKKEWQTVVGMLHKEQRRPIDKRNATLIASLQTQVAQKRADYDTALQFIVT